MSLQRYERDLPKRTEPGSVANGSSSGGSAFGQADRSFGHYLIDFFRVLRRHRWLVGGVAVITFAAAAWLVLSEPPRYLSTAVFQIEETGPSIGGLRSAPVMMGRSADPLVTTLEVLHSRSVVGEVVESEGLRELPDGTMLTREEAIDRLLKDVSSRFRERTSIVDVRYTADDPDRAERVVDALVRQFVQYSAASAQQESRRQREFLQEQLAQVDSVLRIAQAELSDFRSRRGIYSSREQAAAQQTGLLTVQVRREEMDADRQMYQALLQALDDASEEDQERRIRTIVSAPGIASNPVVSQLYGRLIQYGIARDSLTTGTWSSARSNPDVDRLEQLIQGTRTHLKDAVRSHIDAMGARITALDRLHERITADLRMIPAVDAEEARLVQQVQTIRAMAEELNQQLQGARMAEAIETGQVKLLDPASTARPMNGSRWLRLAFGLVLGLVFGGVAAIIAENTNTSIRSKEDVERVLGLAALGMIPRLHVGNGKRSAIAAPRPRAGEPAGNSAEPSHELVAVHENRSAGAEAYRTLRTNLLFSRMGERLKMVVVTSAGEAEGKSTAAANLAAAFAQQGMKVLLVDCDLRKARLHRVFGQERTPGVTEWLAGSADSAEAIRGTAVPNLDFLPAGTLPPNPSELVGSSRMRRLLRDLTSSYDLVLFDTPPLRAAGDAAVLGSQADGVVMVVRAGSTNERDAQEAVRQLRTVSAPILGVVLNDPDGSAAKYGAYYQYEYYGEAD